MERVLITSRSGAGRTTVLDELRGRGDVTLDIDYDGWELPDCGWVRGPYVESALHVLNHRRTGGHYWYRGGRNPAALAAWARGGAVGVLSNSTESSTGRWPTGLAAST